MLVFNETGHLVDVNGAFLRGWFEDGEKIYMSIPKGFERFYPKDCLLLLRKTLYGCKQAAMAFWRLLVETLNKLGLFRSKADPCLFFKWTQEGPILWVSWIDDLMIVTPKTEDLMEDEKNAFKERFDCDDNGEIHEYVGCKVEWIDGGVKLTHPVVIQSLEHEFDIPSGGKITKSPAPAGEVLAEGDERFLLGPCEQKTYRSRIGKLMYLARWTRPDILFAVRSLAKFNGKAAQVHMKALNRIMKYVINTRDKGLFIKLQEWTTRTSKKFVITGYSDSDYANDMEN